MFMVHVSHLWHHHDNYYSSKIPMILMISKSGIKCVYDLMDSQYFLHHQI